MKKYLFIVPLFLICCKKEVSQENKEVEFQDSSSVVRAIRDSSKSSETPVPKQDSISQKEIFKTIDASKLPWKSSEHFSLDGQALLLSIENFDKKNITVKILPENPQMNIRLSQIKLPDGTMDGPFGRSLENYPVKGKGDVTLRITHSNMASGKTKGKFSVEVE